MTPDTYQPPQYRHTGVHGILTTSNTTTKMLTEDTGNMPFWFEVVTQSEAVYFLCTEAEETCFTSLLTQTLEYP